jgi:peptidoglycan-associated lipoprotein
MNRLALTAIVILVLAACGDTDPACDQDSDCAAGEVCVDGQCQQCRADADCPAGQQCRSGACVSPPPECSSDAACGAGRRCEAGRCVAMSTSDETTDGPASCTMADVYFGYDSATLGEEARSALGESASCIESRHTQVTVTGMTDPRGVEEYNLALGDRRAHAVRVYLERLGVAHEAVRTVSMGEERATGTDEASWVHDRRATLAPR